MNSRLIPNLVGVAALAGACHAHAQVNFGLAGVAHAQLEAVNAEGATDPTLDKGTRTRLSNVSSELAVKGSAVVTPDIKAVFALVTGVNVDNGNNNAGGGLWANAKDSYVGLEFHDIGTLKLGRMTAAARWNSGTADFSYAGAGPQDDQSMLSGVSGQSGASPLFNVRLDNAVGFESAAWNGLSMRAYFGANENRSAATVASGAKLNDTSYSVLLRYVVGPLDSRISYERRNDKGTLNNTTTDRTSDKDLRVGIRYALPTRTTLAFGYDRMTLSDSTATGTAKASLRHAGWVASVNQDIGQHAVYVAYGAAPDLHVVLANGTVADTSSTGASEFVLGYQYNFTKQVMLEAFYSQVSNRSRAKYDFDSGGVGPAVGASPKAAGAGLRYVF